MTPESIIEAAEEVMPLFERISKVIQIGVNAVEQYRREGKLTDNEEAMEYVVQFVDDMLPGIDLPNQRIIDMIKASVLLASTYTHTIEAGKAMQEVSN